MALPPKSLESWFLFDACYKAVRLGANADDMGAPIGHVTHLL